MEKLQDKQGSEEGIDTWTRNCKIMIQLNGTPEQAEVLTVRDIKELDRYK